MSRIKAISILIVSSLALFCSCSTIERASRHGFDSGYYNHSLKNGQTEKVYLKITDQDVSVYALEESKPRKLAMTLPMGEADSLYVIPSRFSKTSLDIDITSVFLKYRPASQNLQPQLNADLNVALYAGWRHDYYWIEGRKDPLGINQYKIIKRGFDFGIIAGPGMTFIGPSTTNNATSKEYNAMIIEYGIAVFLETNFASFGLATGYDYLANSDRSIWIYNNKPWIGFVIGIALN
jgi:hypothetical protein